MNPYADLSQEALADELVEVRAEWQDICRRTSELSLEAKVNQDHQKQINQAIGALTMPGNWTVEPRFVPSHDDPFLGQELAVVRSIYD